MKAMLGGFLLEVCTFLANKRLGGGAEGKKKEKNATEIKNSQKKEAEPRKSLTKTTSMER